MFLFSRLVGTQLSQVFSQSCVGSWQSQCEICLSLKGILNWAFLFQGILLSPWKPRGAYSRCPWGKAWLGSCVFCYFLCLQLFPWNMFFFSFANNLQFIVCDQENWNSYSILQEWLFCNWRRTVLQVIYPEFVHILLDKQK